MTQEPAIPHLSSIDRKNACSCATFFRWSSQVDLCTMEVTGGAVSVFGEKVLQAL